MKRLTDSWGFMLGVSLLFFLVLSAGGEYLIFLAKERWVSARKEEILKEAGRVRTLLESEINTTLNLTLGLVIYVASKPDLENIEFQTVARRLMEGTRHIRNMALARDNVISHVYPLKGNEAALGLRFMDNEAQRNAVLKAIETRRTVVAGPVNLVQGGQGFISRSPIFLGEKGGSYWGIASMVTDVDSLYAASGLMDGGMIRYALRGKDGLGEEGELFYGESDTFSSQWSVVLPVTLPNGSWVLAAAPQKGVLDFPNHSLFRAGGFLVSFFMGCMLLGLLNSMKRIRYLAHHDPLTDLPNIRYLEGYMKQLISSSLYRDLPFAILYLDLESFKPVNESFGHKTGDEILARVARRVKDMSPALSLVCRMAGEVFIVVLEEIKSRQEAEMLGQKICEAMEKPFAVGGGEFISIQASVGVSLFPSQGVTSEILIREADQDLAQKRRAANLNGPPTTPTGFR
ncbi:MAG: sensor domain-containing diguanylate cyclase [Desulfobacterales bacterium]|nr:sensor domain-containing diguanylate cyclase [Desulfobacterales bacterium]